MRTLLPLLLLTSHLSPLTLKAQKLFIQANAGIAPANIRQGYFQKVSTDISADPSFTYGMQAGVGLKRFEAGLAVTSQSITEKAQINLGVPGVPGVPPVLLTETKIDYGKALLTVEAFVNGKVTLKPVTLYGGILGGIATTRGKEGIARLSTGATDNTGGDGRVLGIQLGASVAVYRGLSVHAGAAYKDVVLTVTETNNIITLEQKYKLALIPVTAGVRYTF